MNGNSHVFPELGNDLTFRTLFSIQRSNIFHFCRMNPTARRPLGSRLVSWWWSQRKKRSAKNIFEVILKHTNKKTWRHFRYSIRVMLHPKAVPWTSWKDREDIFLSLSYLLQNIKAEPTIVFGDDCKLEILNYFQLTSKLKPCILWAKSSTKSSTD